MRSLEFLIRILNDHTEILESFTNTQIHSDLVLNGKALQNSTILGMITSLCPYDTNIEETKKHFNSVNKVKIDLF